MELWRQELYASAYSQEYLAHHGIKGQRWGVRRFQYEDGSLTPEGRARYLKELSKSYKKEGKALAGRRGVKGWGDERAKAMKNPLLKDFADSTGMDEAVKRLSQEVDAAYWDVQKYAVPSSPNYDSAKANEVIDKYNKVRRDAQKAYKEIGREKVEDYVGSIYDQKIANLGMSHEDVAKLINHYLLFAEQEDGD